MAQTNFGIVVSRSSEPFFKELTQACSQVLIEAGNPVDFLYDIPMNNNYNCVLVIGPHEFPALGKKAPGTKFLALQTEQFPQIGYQVSDLQTRNFHHLRPILLSYDFIFDLYEGNINFLLENQILNCSYFPIGYHSSFDDYQKMKNNIEEYDVALIGLINPRRKTILDRLRKKYKIYETSQLFGKERNEVLLNSKICLNIHVTDSDFFERLRIEALFLSNCRFVISEESLYYSPLIRNKHLSLRHYSQIEQAIDYYLKNDFQRKKIAEDAYKFIKENHLFSINLRQSLRQAGVFI